MKIAFVIFSYKRWFYPKTLKWLKGDDVHLFIPESEKEHFSKENIKIITHKDSEKGLTRKYEMAFDIFRDMGFEAMCKIDDDIEYVRDYYNYLMDKKIETLSKQEFVEIIENGLIMANDLGYKIFGFGNKNRHCHYNPSERFDFYSIFDASIFSYIFDDKIKIDKNLQLRADTEAGR